jgi:hypothetical protein
MYEGLAIERIGEDEGLRMVEKSTGNTLVQLTYASYRYSCIHILVLCAYVLD